MKIVHEVNSYMKVYVAGHPPAGNYRTSEASTRIELRIENKTDSIRIEGDIEQVKSALRRALDSIETMENIWCGESREPTRIDRIESSQCISSPMQDMFTPSSVRDSKKRSN